MQVQDTVEAAAMAADADEAPETWQFLRWYCHCGCEQFGRLAEPKKTRHRQKPKPTPIVPQQKPALIATQPSARKQGLREYIEQLVTLNPDGDAVSKLDYKYCLKCDRVKPGDEFGKRRRRVSDEAGGWILATWCRACVTETKNIKQPYTPEIGRRNSLKAKYGLSIEDFELMVTSQDGLCAICAEVPEVRKRGRGDGGTQHRGFSIDHDHVTGKVRDLLCAPCNQALGLFRDDPVRMDAAAAYIRRHTKLDNDVLSRLNPH